MTDAEKSKAWKRLTDRWERAAKRIDDAAMGRYTRTRLDEMYDLTMALRKEHDDAHQA